MRIPSRMLWVLVAGFGCAIAASADARAQTLLTVTPSLVVGPVAESNVFSRPSAESDLIWRFTSGVAATRESPRALVRFGYTVNTDRYRDHPALTTVFARHDASVDGVARPTASDTLTFAVDYIRTRAPSEFNLLASGLVTGREQAWRAHAGASLRHVLTSRSSITAGYDFALSGMATGEGLRVFAGRVEVARTFGPRDVIRGVYRHELSVFRPDVRASVSSHIGVVGWTRDLTPTAELSVEAGPRLTDGNVTPELAVSWLRAFGTSDASLAYTHTQTTALGISEPIVLDSVLATASLRGSGSYALQLQGGLYNNRLDTSSIRAYLFSAGVSRRLAGAASLTASYTFTQQRSGFGDRLDAINRHIVLLQVGVSPTFGRRSTPPVVSEGQRRSTPHGGNR